MDRLGGRGTGRQVKREGWGKEDIKKEGKEREGGATDFEMMYS